LRIENDYGFTDSVLHTVPVFHRSGGGGAEHELRRPARGRTERNDARYAQAHADQARRERAQKLLDKGAQIKLDAESLAKEVAAGRLPRASEKKLREIEKSARQIRSEFGGAGDNEALDSPPNNLADALKLLDDASERLNKSLGKTSRRVVSVTVIEIANEIAQLVKILRGYLN
jgi:hypothetical protein